MLVPRKTCQGATMTQSCKAVSSGSVALKSHWPTGVRRLLKVSVELPIFLAQPKWTWHHIKDDLESFGCRELVSFTWLISVCLAFKNIMGEKIQNFVILNNVYTKYCFLKAEVKKMLSEGRNVLHLKSQSSLCTQKSEALQFFTKLFISVLLDLLKRNTFSI